MPLARAVTTYGLWSSSSRLARITRVSRAVPATPSTTAGSQTWARRSSTRATLQGASTNSGENSPVTPMPNQAKAIHISTSASMKFGVATPT